MLSKKKHTHKNRVQINSVSQKVLTAWGNFSQGAGMPGAQRDIAFSQLAVKGLTKNDNDDDDDDDDDNDDDDDDDDDVETLSDVRDDRTSLLRHNYVTVYIIIIIIIL
jgi:hypothetical protein